MNTIIVNLALNLLLNLIAPVASNHTPSDAPVKEPKVEVEASAGKGKITIQDLIL